MDLGQKISFIYRINCLWNQFWDLFEKTPFFHFLRAKFGQKTCFSSLCVTLTNRGNWCGDCRLVLLSRYFDLKNHFRPQNVKILAIFNLKILLKSEYLRIWNTLKSPYLSPTIVIVAYIGEKPVFWPNMGPQKMENGVFSKRSQKWFQRQQDGPSSGVKLDLRWVLKNTLSLS